MGSKLIQKEQKKTKIPFFGKGVLEFAESHHTLTHNKGYVCSKKQKGQCKLPEQRIKVESLERNFSRLAKTLELPEKRKWPVVKEIIGKILHGQVDNFLDSNDFYDEIVDSSVAVAQEDIQKGRPGLFKKDLNEATNAIVKQNEKDTGFLSGMLIGVVLVFAKKEISEIEMGRTLAYLSKKVYLTNEGKISKIKLHPLGDYVFQYIEKRMPEYIKPSELFVERYKFESLDFKQVNNKIKRGDLPEVYIPQIALGYQAVKFSGMILSKLPKMTPDEALQSVIELQNSPMGQIAMHMNKMLKTKPRK